MSTPLSDWYGVVKYDPVTCKREDVTWGRGENGRQRLIEIVSIILANDPPFLIFIETVTLERARLIGLP